MSFSTFLDKCGWAVVLVAMAVVVFVVVNFIFRKGLSKALAPLEDTKEAYTKMWIALGLSSVVAVGGYYFADWALHFTVAKAWYALGAVIGCVFALVAEFKKAGLKLSNVKKASEQVTADIEGIREVAKKAGIVDDAKFDAIMTKVNDEIKASFAEIEKAKDEKTVALFKEALISYLIADGELDATDKAVLKAKGVTDDDLAKSKVMFDFLNETK